MILVTVGTHQQPFDRLVKAADDFASTTDETVIIQTGAATYEPKYAEHFRWASSQAMESLTQESRAVVTQASAGAVLLAIQYGKPIVVTPRLSRYGENFNDHQRQLAKALAECGQAVLLENPTAAGLQAALDCAWPRIPSTSSRDQLVIELRSQFERWESQARRKKTGRGVSKSSIS